MSKPTDKPNEQQNSHPNKGERIAKVLARAGVGKTTVVSQLLKELALHLVMLILYEELHSRRLQVLTLPRLDLEEFL